MGPGEELAGEPVELKVEHQDVPGEISPYERLLGEAMAGEQALFAREDTVELAWKIVDPVLAGALPIYPYDPKTWGPEEADSILLGDTKWHAPVVNRSE
jgi:glucose-6-phosphate 1-dehydrogenase